MKDYCEYSHDLPPIWTQLTVKLSHKEKPCPVINLDDSYPSVFLHSQFGMREKIRPQQLVGLLLYPFIARFVGSSEQFQPDEQRLLFGPLRRHNEIVREQDRLRIFAPKSQFLLLDLIGMRRSDPISIVQKQTKKSKCFCQEIALFFFSIQTLPQAQSVIHESTTQQPPGSVVSERMPWCGHVQAWPCHGCHGCRGCRSDAEV